MDNDWFITFDKNGDIVSAFRKSAVTAVGISQPGKIHDLHGNYYSTSDREPSTYVNAGGTIIDVGKTSVKDVLTKILGGSVPDPSEICDHD